MTRSARHRVRNSRRRASIEEFCSRCFALTLRSLEMPCGFRKHSGSSSTSWTSAKLFHYFSPTSARPLHSCREPTSSGALVQPAKASVVRKLQGCNNICGIPRIGKTNAEYLSEPHNQCASTRDMCPCEDASANSSKSNSQWSSITAGCDDPS